MLMNLLYFHVENSMKNMIFYILTILLSMVALTACGTLSHEVKESQNPPSVQAPIKAPDQVEEQTNLALKQARQLLSEKDYIGTINLIQEEIRKGGSEKALAKEYLQAVNASLSQAETFMSEGHYQNAALLLKTVQNSYPRNPKLKKQVTATPEQLKVKIDFCTDNLMEAGLIAYRSGEFATAINIWQQVLAIDPQHQVAQSSIQTTEQQLSKLKSLNKND